jgi:hypothetical protein
MTEGKLIELLQTGKKLYNFSFKEGIGEVTVEAIISHKVTIRIHKDVHHHIVVTPTMEVPVIGEEGMISSVAMVVVSKVLDIFLKTTTKIKMAPTTNDDKTLLPNPKIFLFLELHFISHFGNGSI